MAQPTLIALAVFGFIIWVLNWLFSYKLASNYWTLIYLFVYQMGVGVMIILSFIMPTNFVYEAPIDVKSERFHDTIFVSDTYGHRWEFDKIKYLDKQLQVQKTTGYALWGYKVALTYDIIIK